MNYFKAFMCQFTGHKYEILDIYETEGVWEINQCIKCKTVTATPQGGW